MEAAMAMPQTSKEDREREEKWRAEADLRTLVEADAIKADKARWRRAMKMAKEQMAALEAVGGEDDD